MNIKYWSHRWSLGVRICYLNAKIRKHNLAAEIAELDMIRCKNRIIILTKQIKATQAPRTD